MNKEEYQKWLDGLKIGDEVYCTWTKSVEKVQHITKGRQIDVRNNRYKNGEYWSGHRWDSTYKIQPVTQAVLDGIELLKLKNKHYRINVEHLTLDQLRRIDAIVSEGKNE